MAGVFPKNIYLIYGASEKDRLNLADLLLKRLSEEGIYAKMYTNTDEIIISSILGNITFDGLKRFKRDVRSIQNINKNYVDNDFGIFDLDDPHPSSSCAIL